MKPTISGMGGGWDKVIQNKFFFLCYLEVVISVNKPLILVD